MERTEFSQTMQGKKPAQRVRGIRVNRGMEVRMTTISD